MRNNFLRTISQEDRLKYNKLLFFCKKALRTAKKIYLSNLDIKKWLIIEISVKQFLHLFCKMLKIISELQIPSIPENTSNLTDVTDPVLAAISMFQDLPSIKNIRAAYDLFNTLSFKDFVQTEVYLGCLWSLK